MLQSRRIHNTMVTSIRACRILNLDSFSHLPYLLPLTYTFSVPIIRTSTSLQSCPVLFKTLSWERAPFVWTGSPRYPLNPPSQVNSTINKDKERPRGQTPQKHSQREDDTNQSCPQSKLPPSNGDATGQEKFGRRHAS